MPTSEEAAGATALPVQHHRAGLAGGQYRIKFLGEGEWKRKKHWAEYRRQGRKVHLGIDAHSLEIRAIEVPDNSVGDALRCELLAQIPPDEDVAGIGADSAYDTRTFNAAIAQRDAKAKIPPRKNGKPWKATLSHLSGELHT